MGFGKISVGRGGALGAVICLPTLYSARPKLVD